MSYIRNVVCSKHKDSGNVGDYTVEKFDSTIPHESEEFQGTWYSLVFCR